MSKAEGSGDAPPVSHNRPYLFVDRVKEYKSGEGIECGMTIRGDESYLSGHFPGRPMLPGVFEVEAMFQAAEAFVALEGGAKGRRYNPGEVNLVKIVSAKFLRPITPPADLTVSTRLMKIDGEEMNFKGSIYNDTDKCAESSFTIKVS
jgi:3-hydroxyacyl-[acyl-carrier-protein] dehydratase